MAKKFRQRYLKKAHRTALHGLPRHDTPPSLLQTLRMVQRVKEAFERTEPAA